MTDTQILTIVLALVPSTVVALVGILVNNARLTDLSNRMDQRFGDMDRKFGDMDRKLDHRFEDLKELWRSELHRVEEILDARLKHIEER